MPHRDADMHGIGDIYPIVRFLRISPLHDYKVWNRLFARRHAKSLERVNLLLRAFVLRRTKHMQVPCESGAGTRPLLALPEKAVRVEQVPMSAEERKMYDALYSCVRERVVRKLGGHFQNTLVLIKRLRQMCISAELLPPDLRAALRAGGDSVAALLDKLGASGIDRIKALVDDHIGDECPAWRTSLAATIRRAPLRAGTYSIRAAPRPRSRSAIDTCPICQALCTAAQLLAPEALREWSAGPTAQRVVLSSKLQHVVRLVEKAEGSVVVFSNFVPPLAMLAAAFKERGVAAAVLQGSMSREQRGVAVTQLQSGKVRVLLCSLACAGTGITLTAAHTVVMVDPWWNPAAEDQAIDRVHRIGQPRKVEVIRLVAQASVEAKMISLQEQKRDVMRGALCATTDRK